MKSNPVLARQVGMAEPLCGRELNRSEAPRNT